MGTNHVELSNAEFCELENYAQSTGLPVQQAVDKAAMQGIEDRVLFSRGSPRCDVVEMSKR